MKKIFSIILVITIIVIGNICYAVEESYTNQKQNNIEEENSIEINITGLETIEEGNNTYHITLTLGKLENIMEDKIMAFQTNLEYDDNLIGDITLKGANNWVLSYNKDSKILIGDVDKAKSNQEIGQMEITLKEGAKVGQKGSIVFKDMLIIGNDVETTVQKEANFEIVPKEESTQKENDTINENTNNVDTNNSQVDNTIANKIIPAAGIGKIIGVSILIIAILAGIFKFKSRKIKY
mgnify:CR=1 FL=1